jgi:hypothetical protein
MTVEESVTWHAENVAHVIKRMHHLQKKMERELVALEKESPNNPGGITEKFGVENDALLEAIDRIAHSDKKEMEEAEAGFQYVKKFTTLDNGLRANLNYMVLALEWCSYDALLMLQAILKDETGKPASTSATIYYLKELTKVALDILNCCEDVYVSKASIVPMFDSELFYSKLKAIRKPTR